MICREGDSANAFFLIKKGDVEISKENNFITKIGDGSYFGESVFSKREVTRSATVTAISTVGCITFDK